MSRKIWEEKKRAMMLQMFLVKGEFLMMVKVFQLYLLVARVMDGFLTWLIHFIFILIKATTYKVVNNTILLGDNK